MDHSCLSITWFLREFYHEFVIFIALSQRDQSDDQAGERAEGGQDHDDEDRDTDPALAGGAVIILVIVIATRDVPVLIVQRQLDGLVTWVLHGDSYLILWL